MTHAYIAEIQAFRDSYTEKCSLLSIEPLLDVINSLAQYDASLAQAQTPETPDNLKEATLNLSGLSISLVQARALAHSLSTTPIHTRVILADAFLNDDGTLS